MGSNPGTLYQTAENFVVGAAALLRGRCFLISSYGSVGGGPLVAAPVPTGFGFQEIPDFREDSERQSLPTGFLLQQSKCTYSKPWPLRLLCCG